MGGQSPRKEGEKKKAPRIGALSFQYYNIGFEIQNYRRLDFATEPTPFPRRNDA